MSPSPARVEEEGWRCPQKGGSETCAQIWMGLKSRVLREAEKARLRDKEPELGWSDPGLDSSMENVVQGPSPAEHIRVLRSQGRCDALLKTEILEMTELRYLKKIKEKIASQTSNIGQTWVVKEARDKAEMEIVTLKWPKWKRITIPFKTEDLRLTGLDYSVTPGDVRAAFAVAGGCPPEEIRVGDIRRATGSLGMIWAPMTAAIKAARTARIRVGWDIVGVALLKARPLQCIGCLGFGHVKSACPSPEMEQARCYL
ncbi:PREDICTED: uncharacterized protein LOC106750243 [Dinoponera quadriceps]|uniref:Uncharacterized protein LOC106750243 n=1 Tax=Dinoponera quadriceps TaxID=609295 RepID=A0A6P3Y6I2_DINQU|nr:PREDICTED: uncharacterized protein LOC106750243 [Dinoponera quadriceps]